VVLNRLRNEGPNWAKRILIPVLRLPVKGGENETAIGALKRAMFHIRRTKHIAPGRKGFPFHNPGPLKQNVRMIAFMNVTRLHVTRRKGDEHIPSAGGLVLGKDLYLYSLGEFE
jgi:hypothetical protein